MKRPIVRTLDILIITCVTVIVGLWFIDAEASGDCRDGSCNSNNDNDIIIKDIVPQASGGTANVAVDGGRHDSFGIGLANTLGDPRIGDCVVTTQLGIVVFNIQGFKENPWCMALWFDSQGLREMAARMRCRVDDIREEFKDGRRFDKQACIAANTVQPINLVPRVDSSTQDEKDSQLVQQALDEFRVLVTAQNERIQNLEEEEAREEKRRRQAQNRPQVVIREEQLISDEERVKLEAFRVSK